MLRCNIGAAPAGQLLDLLRCGAGAAVDYHMSPQALGELQPRINQIHAYDTRAGDARQLGDKLPNNAQAKHGDRLTQVDLRIQNTIQRDCADLRENAQDRLDMPGGESEHAHSRR